MQRMPMRLLDIIRLLEIFICATSKQPSHHNSPARCHCAGLDARRFDKLLKAKPNSADALDFGSERAAAEKWPGPSRLLCLSACCSSMPRCSCDFSAEASMGASTLRTGFLMSKSCRNGALRSLSSNLNVCLNCGGLRNAGEVGDADDCN